MTLCLGFAACSDDDDNEKDSTSKVVGKWQMYEATPSTDYEPCDFKGWITFNQDGTYSDYDYCTRSTTGGTWVVTANTITITADVFPVPLAMKIVSITDSEMVLQFTILNQTTSAKYKRI